MTNLHHHHTKEQTTTKHITNSNGQEGPQARHLHKNPPSDAARVHSDRLEGLGTARSFKMISTGRVRYPGPDRIEVLQVRNLAEEGLADELVGLVHDPVGVVHLRHGLPALLVDADVGVVRDLVLGSVSTQGEGQQDQAQSHVHGHKLTFAVLTPPGHHHNNTILVPKLNSGLNGQSFSMKKKQG